MRTTLPHFAILLAMLPLALAIACGNAGATVPLPDPQEDHALRTGAARDTAVFAGGCFWGIEAVFEHVKGVMSSTSGYSGGAANTADYEQVSSGTTGHAESVQVIYDPAVVTYGQLLKVFFSVAHNPTELNFQGPDHGTQYRSAIFYANAEQEKLAKAYIAQLTKAKVFSEPIVTQVTPLVKFYAAEAYHQDYLDKHPDQPYIVYNDMPKVAALKKEFPQLYK
jgi:peptide-methionine (S)-S-oxide reductase